MTYRNKTESVCYVAVAVVVLAAFLAPAGAPAREPADRRQIVVLFTTDLYGRFTGIACGKPDPAADFANLVSAVGFVRAKQAEAGRPLPLVLNGGDMTDGHRRTVGHRVRYGHPFT